MNDDIFSLLPAPDDILLDGDGVIDPLNTHLIGDITIPAISISPPPLPPPSSDHHHHQHNGDDCRVCLWTQRAMDNAISDDTVSTDRIRSLAHDKTLMVDHMVETERSLSELQQRYTALHEDWKGKSALVQSFNDDVRVLQQQLRDAVTAIRDYKGRTDTAEALLRHYMTALRSGFSAWETTLNIHVSNATQHDIATAVDDFQPLSPDRVSDALQTVAVQVVGLTNQVTRLLRFVNRSRPPMNMSIEVLRMHFLSWRTHTNTMKRISVVYDHRHHHGQMTKMFYAWRVRTKLTSHFMACFTVAIAQHNRRIMKRAWETWRSQWLERAAGGMTTMTMTATHTGVLDVVNATRLASNTRVLVVLVNAIRRRSLQHALYQWRAFIRSEQQTNTRNNSVRILIQQHQRRRLIVAFNRWHHSTMMDTIEKLKVAWSQQRTHVERMTFCFSYWRFRAQQRRLLLTTLQSLLQRKRTRRIRRVFRLWCDLRRANARSAVLLNSTNRVYDQLLLCKSMNKWIRKTAVARYTHTIRENTTVYERDRRLMNAQCRALENYCEIAMHRRRNEAIMRNAWYTWFDIYMKRRQFEKCLNSRHRAHMTEILHKWRQYTVEHRHQSVLAQQNAETDAVVTALTDTIRELQSDMNDIHTKYEVLAYTARDAVKTIRHGDQRRVIFQQWMHAVLWRRGERQRYAEFVQRRTQRVTTRCLYAWLYRLYHIRTLQQQCVVMCHGGVVKLKRQLWDHWRQRLLERQYIHRVLYDSYRKRILAIALNMWRTFTVRTMVADHNTRTREYEVKTATLMERVAYLEDIPHTDCRRQTDEMQKQLNDTEALSTDQRARLLQLEREVKWLRHAYEQEKALSRRSIRRYGLLKAKYEGDINVKRVFMSKLQEMPNE